MRLIDTTDASLDGDSFVTQGFNRGGWRAVQVEITTAATVTVQGRCAADMPWVDLVEMTESGADMVSHMPRMRAVVTGNTGTVRVELDG